MVENTSRCNAFAMTLYSSANCSAKITASQGDRSERAWDRSAFWCHPASFIHRHELRTRNCLPIAVSTLVAITCVVYTQTLSVSAHNNFTYPNPSTTATQHTT